MKGKAIYQPKGAAAEYAKYACNFYTGCSNDCQYYYYKRGVMAHTWGNTPKLKKCFKDEDHALAVFEKELKENLPELQKYGLFFSFSTDPMLPETIKLTAAAIFNCILNDVKVKILTKRADFIEYIMNFNYTISNVLGENIKFDNKKIFKNIAFGFTLTGRDDLEPNASTNAERIEAMKKLHDAGFKTWASIEPIIDFESSIKMMDDTRDFCDLYKVGLLSRGFDPHKQFSKHTYQIFINRIERNVRAVYFKDSLLAQAGIPRDQLPANCVSRDYNVFNN